MDRSLSREEIPRDLPRNSPAIRAEVPLEPTPLEMRRAQLDARAGDRQPLDLPQPERKVSSGGDAENDGGASLARPHLQDHERRVRRDRLPTQAVGLALRAEELQALTEVGRFRVVAARDIAATIYGGNGQRMERDLRFLRQQGLIETNAVNARRDGRFDKVERIEVVTLTNKGRALVARVAELPEGQRLYSGLVKPREAEHDTQVYRAYLKEAERIERSGGSNLRVVLDFELKSEIQKAIHAARKADPEREMAEIKQGVAERFELPYRNERIQIPDARIEYELDQGSLTGHVDIEVLTGAYRPGHIRAKAGFRSYASAADRASISGRVEDEHQMMRDIFEL
jgi:hypothetical protein